MGYLFVLSARFRNSQNDFRDVSDHYVFDFLDNYKIELRDVFDSAVRGMGFMIPFGYNQMCEINIGLFWAIEKFFQDQGMLYEAHEFSTDFMEFRLTLKEMNPVSIPESEEPVLPFDD